MDVSKLVTNCPNCGGELTPDGYCQYCNTKVRLANAMEIETGQFVSKPVEIIPFFAQKSSCIMRGILASDKAMYFSGGNLR